LAAVLAVGEDAVLSHRSAAAIWALRPTSRLRPEVTVGRGVRSRADIQVHEAPLPADEVTVRHGIPVTTVPRTLVDLASVVRPAQLRRAVEQAEVMRLADPLPLGAVLERHRGRVGVANLAAIVAEGRIDATVTRSELERRFLAFLEERGLPRPAVKSPWPRATRSSRSTARGRTGASSSSWTALPTTPRARPSRPTAAATARSRPRDGAPSESHGASSTRTPTASPRTWTTSSD
jgi:hypothetical protein